MTTTAKYQEFKTEVVPLSEASTAKETGSVRAIRVIAPGWGSSGYYPAQVLERDGPRVFKEGLHMYLDHPAPFDRPERSIRDLAGVLESGAEWMEHGPIGPGLYAKARIHESHRELINTLAPHIGVSVRAFGLAEWGEAEGREGDLISAIVEAASVDFVTAAGAGGKVLEILESANMSEIELKAQIATLEASLSAKDAALADKETKISEAQARINDLEQSVARFEETAILRDARDVVGGLLVEADVPERTKMRLLESASKNPPVTDGKLDKESLTTKVEEAIKAELTYLAEVTGAGRVTGMGTSTPAEATTDDLAKELQMLGLSESAAKYAARI